MTTPLDAAVEQLGDRHPLLSATFSEGRIETRVIGASEEADAEIGSISKGLTGLLLHSAIARGELSLDTKLGDVLTELDPSLPAAGLTIDQLATHTSGLPRLPKTRGKRGLTRRLLRMYLRGTNPYGDSFAERISDAAAVRSLGPNKHSYSNFGFELLGAALSRAAAVPYSELLSQRLCAPLNLHDTYAPLTPADVKSIGLLAKRTQPWTGEALAASGGVRSTAADLGKLLEALTAGFAPGISALEPRVSINETLAVGSAWMTTTDDQGSFVWHNGGTLATGSWLGFDRALGVGAALVQLKPAAALDRPGAQLLNALRASARA